MPLILLRVWTGFYTYSCPVYVNRGGAVLSDNAEAVRDILYLGVHWHSHQKRCVQGDSSVSDEMDLISSLLRTQLPGMTN